MTPIPSAPQPPRFLDWGYGAVNMADAKAAGMVGIVRYLSNSPGKNLSAAERDAALAAGLDILLVWETTETRCLAGSAAGHLDGLMAAQQAAVLGYPKGATIFAACDTDTTWAAVAPYVKAFVDVVAGAGYIGEVYGGYLVVNGAVGAGVSTMPWQTTAWSKIGGPRHDELIIDMAACLIQNQYHVPVSGVDCDSSNVLRPVNGWHANINPPPAPVADHPGTKGTPMQIIRAQGRGAATLDGAGIAHPIDASKWSALVHLGQKGATVEIVTLATADYDACIPGAAAIGAKAMFGAAGPAEPDYDPFSLDGVPVEDTVKA